MRGPAAVDGQGGSGDLRRFVAAQEDSKGAELLHRDELLGRLGLEQHIAHDLLLADTAGLRRTRDLLLDKRSQDIAGTDRVASDAELCRLQRHGLGQSHHAVLGRYIG